MRGLTSLKLSDLDSCRLIHISGSHFDVTATLIQRLMTQAIREHRMPVKALSKIHLIPPGRAKFPPSHLKSRGGWLLKKNCRHRGWLGERPDCAVCRLVHSFDGRSGSIMGRRPPKLWASRLRAAAPVDVAGALMTFFARGRRRARVPARVRRCFGARSDSAARAPEFSRQ